METGTAAGLLRKDRRTVHQQEEEGEARSPRTGVYCFFFAFAISLCPESSWGLLSASCGHLRQGHLPRLVSE